MAGPATTAAAAAGQSAYAASHARPSQAPSTAASSPGARAERPRWMRRHALGRGLILLVLAQICLIVILNVTRPGSVVADLFSLGCLIMSVVGLAGVAVGIKDALERRSARRALKKG